MPTQTPRDTRKITNIRNDIRKIANTSLSDITHQLLDVLSQAVDLIEDQQRQIDELRGEVARLRNFA